MDSHDMVVNSLSDLIPCRPTLKHSIKDLECSRMMQMAAAHAVEATYGRIQIPVAQDSKYTYQAVAIF